MERSRSPRVTDRNGALLTDRIQKVLDDLVPRLKRHFPALQDDITLTEVMEEAGRRIVLREKRGGPIEKLHGYAWVTLRSVATSRMRLGSTRLIQRTLESDASEFGSPNRRYLVSISTRVRRSSRRRRLTRRSENQKKRASQSPTGQRRQNWS